MVNNGNKSICNMNKTLDVQDMFPARLSLWCPLWVKVTHKSNKKKLSSDAVSASTVFIVTNPEIHFIFSSKSWDPTALKLLVYYWAFGAIM